MNKSEIALEILRLAQIPQLDIDAKDIQELAMKRAEIVAAAYNAIYETIRPNPVKLG